MSNEASKTVEIWKKEGLYDRYISNAVDVLDVGAGQDLFVSHARRWDVEDGDAQLLEGVGDGSYDLVASFHCLEHLRDPREAVINWWRVVKPGGVLAVVVPSEDLYEQHRWPSQFNPDHKWTFALYKSATWSPRSINLLDLIRGLPDASIQLALIRDTCYDYSMDGIDQTTGKACAQLEMIVKKQTTKDYEFVDVNNLQTCRECGRAQLCLEFYSQSAGAGKIQVHLKCGFCGEGQCHKLNLKS